MQSGLLRLCLGNRVQRHLPVLQLGRRHEEDRRAAFFLFQRAAQPELRQIFQVNSGLPVDGFFDSLGKPPLKKSLGRGADVLNCLLLGVLALLQAR